MQSTIEGAYAFRWATGSRKSTLFSSHEAHVPPTLIDPSVHPHPPSHSPLNLILLFALPSSDKPRVLRQAMVLPGFMHTVYCDNTRTRLELVADVAAFLVLHLDLSAPVRIALVFEGSLSFEFATATGILNDLFRGSLLVRLVASGGAVDGLFLLNIGPSSQAFIELAANLEDNLIRPLSLNTPVIINHLAPATLPGCPFCPRAPDTPFSFFFHKSVVQDALLPDACVVMQALQSRLDFVAQVKSVLETHKLVAVLDKVAQVEQEYQHLVGVTLSGKLLSSPDALGTASALEQQLRTLQASLST